MVCVKILWCIVFSLFILPGIGQEICNNGVDDDGDGKIDLNDGDCSNYNFSFIKNPSFEIITGCPDNWSKLQLASGWSQHHATAGSTDLFHKCGNCSFILGNGPFNQIPQPVPHGEGIAGFYDVRDYDQFGHYKESLTTCLVAPLQQNAVYVLEFYVGFLNGGNANMISNSPATVAFYAHPDCTSLLYGHASAAAYRGCPIAASSAWKQLLSVEVAGSAGDWVKVTREFTAPINAQGLVIGPACTPSPLAGNNYYLLDKVLLYKKSTHSLPFITRNGDICADTLTLKAGINPGTGSFSYQWYKDNIALTGQNAAELKVTRARFGEGEYAVRMMVNGLSYLSPPEVVKINELQVSIEDSLAICGGEPITIKPAISTRQTDCPVSYLWNDGSTGTTLTTSTPGNYWFETNKNGCRNRVHVYVAERNAPIVDLGEDTVLCEGDTIQLLAGAEGNGYTWHDFSASPSYIVRTAGNYSVLVSNGYCTGKDTVQVSLERMPYVLFSDDTILCQGEEKVLMPEVYGQSFLWSTGDTSRMLKVDKAGVYQLKATNFCGSTAKTIRLVKGSCQFYLPTAFTPNNDGLNDKFGLTYHSFIREYQLTVYSRWGEVVFKTSNPAARWDGSVKEAKGEPGVYVWTVTYTDWRGKRETRKGTVALLR